LVKCSRITCSAHVHATSSRTPAGMCRVHLHLSPKASYTSTLRPHRLIVKRMARSAHVQATAALAPAAMRYTYGSLSPVLPLATATAKEKEKDNQPPTIVGKCSSQSSYSNNSCPDVESV
jgi:hypothetical protein